VTISFSRKAVFLGVIKENNMAIGKLITAAGNDDERDDNCVCLGLKV
jgi:hypothetical protein